MFVPRAPFRQPEVFGCQKDPDDYFFAPKAGYDTKYYIHM